MDSVTASHSRKGYRRFAHAVLAFIAVHLIISANAAHTAPNHDESAKSKMAIGLESMRRGEFGNAAKLMEEAATLYKDAGNRALERAALIKAAESYRSLGLFGKSLTAYAKVIAVSKSAGDKAGVALGNIGAGEVHVFTGSTGKAPPYLTEALALARQTGDEGLTGAALNAMGSYLMAKGEYGKAVESFTESVKLAEASGDADLAAEAELNLASLLPSGDGADKAEKNLDRAASIIRRLEDSHKKSYMLMAVGRLYRHVASSSPRISGPLAVKGMETLKEAVESAGRAGANLAKSYALGNLGHAYEEMGRGEEALEFTRRAMFAAQESQAPESLYRWQWQSARINNSLGRLDAAVTQYRQATRTMRSIRDDLAACRDGGRATFHDAAGPLFLEFVDLLLKKAGEQRDDATATPWLVEARDTTELLKEAELQDYFEDECASTVKAKAASVEKLSPNTAVVYTILLPDRAELLLSLPSGLKRFVSPAGREKLLEDARKLRVYLEKRTTSEYMPYSQKIYNLLIRPIEDELTAQKVDTLIFVSDAALRAIPMAALHDGTRFLITKYAVAVTPGLSLTDPRPIQRQRANVLLLGLTEGVQGFPPLASVGEELSGIENVYDHTTLRDREFVSANVEKEMKKSRYSVMHVASHGKFEGNVRDSFLLTFDGRLSLDKVQQIVGSAQYRENPVELLTLSACQTATGDDRAALGLAGVAVKSGARSALATLWSVNDPAASALVTEFYKQVQLPSLMKVKALQNAQIKLLNDRRYRHPGYWSAFILIGNWL